MAPTTKMPAATRPVCEAFTHVTIGPGLDGVHQSRAWDEVFAAAANFVLSDVHRVAALRGVGVREHRVVSGVVDRIGVGRARPID